MLRMGVGQSNCDAGSRRNEVHSKHSTTGQVVL